MYSQTELSSIVNKALDDLQLPADPAHLYAPIRYILSLGGKRLRPVLALMSANIYTDNIEPILPAALSIELFHNFTLIHDDIMDEAPLRRNRPSVHKRWDRDIALLSGDALSIMAYRTLEDAPEESVMRLFHEFNETALRVCEGQQLDMDFESQEAISTGQYLTMIGLKTAALIEGALKTGAIAAGAPEPDIDILARTGYWLGIAFQIQDDYLDVYGDQELFGKKTGGDILNNKKTYLLVSALELADGSLKKQLLELVSGEKPWPDAEKIKAVQEIYDTLGIKEKTIEVIRDNTLRSMDTLKDLQKDEHRLRPLLDVIGKLLIREH